MTESFNSWLGKIRGMPIVQIFDIFRQNCMIRLHKRYARACSWEEKLTPQAKITLNKVINASRACKLIPGRNDEYEVTEGKVRYVVHLKDRKCSCKWREISGIPCKHAAICIGYKKDNPEEYIDEVHYIQRYLKAYSGVIHPLPQMDLETDDTSLHMYPPPMKRLPGRLRLNRTRQEGEARPSTERKRSCTVRCKNSG